MTSQKLELYNGHKMDLIGLGTWKSKPGEVKAAVEAAIDCGYRHIDCAWLYQNEDEIGDAIQTKINQGVVKREELFIVTKLWHIFHDPKDVRTGFFESLKALKLDYVDLYHMHSPMGYQKISKKDYAGSDMSIGVELKTDQIMFPRDDSGPLCTDVDYMDTWKEMEKLVDEGLVKSIGISNFNQYQVERVCKEGRIKPAVHQIELHPYLTQVELVEFCQKKGIAMTAYSPFGSPDRPWKPEDEEPIYSHPVIKSIATKVGKSPFQVILRYLNQRNISAIPKSSTPKNIQSNIQVFDFKLSDDQMKSISDLNKNWRALGFEWDQKHKYFPFAENYKE